EKVVSEQGVEFKIEPQEVIFADRNPKNGTDTYRVTVKTKLKQITGFQLDALTQATLPRQGPGRGEKGGFALTEFSVDDGAGQVAKLTNASAVHEQPGRPASAAIDGNADPANGWFVEGLAGAE